MQVNDIYMTDSTLFDAPQNDIRRTCIVREICGEMVKISAAADEQPDVENGLIHYCGSVFIIPRELLEEHFIKIADAVERSK